MGITTSLTVRFTTTRAGLVRFVGGGTFGGEVRVAITGWSDGALVTSPVSMGAGGAKCNLIALLFGPSSWQANAAKLKARTLVSSARLLTCLDMHRH